MKFSLCEIKENNYIIIYTKVLYTGEFMRSYWQSIRSFFHKVYRILWKSALAFINNEDSLKASALTYYTLISLVPFLAVAFGLATGFGFEQYLEDELTQAFDEQQEAMAYAIQFARSLLQNAKGSVIAGVGLVTLLWTNLSMLNSVEGALNDIWKVRQPRTWAKKITDYLAVMIIGPVFVVVSSSLSVYLMTQITETAKESRLLEWMSPYLVLLLRLTPFFLSALLFVIIYMFIPNVRINAKPRIIAGILAGIAFQLWQWIYIKFQVEISNYGAIYGTFAALPLFLLWLQVSWLIVLAGAEIAAHIESEMSYASPKGNSRFTSITQKQLGLVVLQKTIAAYSKGLPPLTTIQIAQDLGVPLMTMQHMLDILDSAGIVVEVSTDGGMKTGYQPSKDAQLFTIVGVRAAIDKFSDWDVAIESTPIIEKVTTYLQELDEELVASKANINFRELG